VAIDNAKLYNMAFYDGLTKVFVRRYVEAWLETEYARVKRYKTNLSLIMFDIDHFKKINDTYGHQAGDYVLQELAQTVKANVRSADIIGRYGGEEFMICLPETPIDKAFNSAQRVRQAVEQKYYRFIPASAWQIYERNQFIIEKEWTDTNYTNAQDLYNTAVKRFEDLKNPQTVISIDIINFLEIIEEQHNWDKLNSIIFCRSCGTFLTNLKVKGFTNFEKNLVEVELI